MGKKLNIAIIGAGFSGAVLARKLAKVGDEITVFETLDHVGGHCYTKRDADTGVMIHVHGPHIFHTNNENVWRFVNSFGEFMPFVNRVKAVVHEHVYTLPINLLTINQFFGRNLNPSQARNFLESLADTSIDNPNSFEEQALRFIGKELYESFFKGYTIKQWGVHPREIPSSVLMRLPIRFNYDDNYYDHRHQGIPRDGYTALIERMLDLPNIRIVLNQKFDRKQAENFDYVFYSGPIDSWFGYEYGRLPYRTLDFEVFRGKGDYQGAAVINYCDQDVPFTRITDHKHFAPWETHEKTIYYREFSRDCGENDLPYYPIRITRHIPILQKYIVLALAESKVIFVGRLGTYRYLDMDVTIMEALKVADAFLSDTDNGLTTTIALKSGLLKNEIDRDK